MAFLLEGALFKLFALDCEKKLYGAPMFFEVDDILRIDMPVPGLSGKQPPWCMLALELLYI